MPAWLKAGLLGAVILVVLSLLNLIPFFLLNCLIALLILAAYVVIGVLAGRYMAPPRNAGKGAGQGALAGVVAAVIHGIFFMILSTIRTAAVGPAATLRSLPPEILDQLYQTGLDPSFFAGVGGALLGGTICCTAGIFLAAALGAAGGAIYSAMKQI